MKILVRSFSIFFLVLFSLQALAQKEFKVQLEGSGEPILLFPGFTSTNEVWEDIVGELSRHYEVHSFTFAGFGGVPPIGSPWLPQIKLAVEDYIRKNNLKQPTVIGHSMGGTLGLWLAADNPDTFKKIIVVDALPAMGALMMPNYKSENIVYDNPYNKQILEMDKTEFAAMAAQIASSMSLNKDKHELLKKWILETDRETYVYGYTDLLKLDLREDLAKITSPVVILAATHPYGKENAEKNYKEQYKHLDSYTLNFADNAGHFIMFDQQEWFLSKLKSELDF